MSRRAPPPPSTRRTRLIDQTVETAVTHGIMDRTKAEADARDLYRRLRLPNPDTIGNRYPHQVSGGQLQRAMTAMAHVLPARPHHLRRADDGARRDDAGRGAGRDRATSSSSSTRRRSTSPTTWPSSRRWRTASWCCATARGRGGADARDAERAQGRLYQDALGRCASSPSEKAVSDDIALLQVHNVDCELWRGSTVLDNVTVDLPRGRTVAVVGESGSGKSTLARAITGLLPPSQGRDLFQRQAAAARR